MPATTRHGAHVHTIPLADWAASLITRIGFGNEVLPAKVSGNGGTATLPRLEWAAAGGTLQTPLSWERLCARQEAEAVLVSRGSTLPLLPRKNNSPAVGVSHAEAPSAKSKQVHAPGGYPPAHPRSLDGTPPVRGPSVKANKRQLGTKRERDGGQRNCPGTSA